MCWDGMNRVGNWIGLGWDKLGWYGLGWVVLGLIGLGNGLGNGLEWDELFWEMC